jgi:hypothetical protein
MENTQQHNDSFEFWKNCFSPRSDEWKRNTLARLNAGQSIFETAEERDTKIKVLKSLLH